MKKLAIALILGSTTAFAGGEYGYKQPNQHQIQGQNQSSVNTNEATSNANAVGYGFGGTGQGGIGQGGNAVSTSRGGAGGYAATASNSGSQSGGNTLANTYKMPNQAPAIVTTSSPSFSQRNCTPVGSVNASGPFGGLGIAFPMGGATCDGLNTADKVAEWQTATGDMKLWLVQCNLMVIANDDLDDAFKESGYSCKQAYNQQVANYRSANHMAKLLK